MTLEVGHLGDAWFPHGPPTDAPAEDGAWPAGPAGVMVEPAYDEQTTRLEKRLLVSAMPLAKRSFEQLCRALPDLWTGSRFVGRVLVGTSAVFADATGTARRGSAAMEVVLPLAWEATVLQRGVALLGDVHLVAHAEGWGKDKLPKSVFALRTVPAPYERSAPSTTERRFQFAWADLEWPDENEAAAATAAGASAAPTLRWAREPRNVDDLLAAGQIRPD